MLEVVSQTLPIENQLLGISNSWLRGPETSRELRENNEEQGKKRAILFMS